MQIEPKSIKNILVVRNDRFGEFLLNIPALRALKETFINAKIIAVVNSSVRELAESIPFIDEIMEWDQGRHSILERVQLFNSLKTKEIGIAVMLNPCKEFNILTYLAGIPIRVGYDRKWGFLLTHKMQDREYLGQKHEIEYNLELVGLIGAKTQEKTLSLTINDSIVNGLFRDFKIGNEDSLIAVHPWTSDAIKQWPLENFCQLSRRLAQEPNAKVLIIGGREELAKSRELFDDFGSNVINMTAKTTLGQLAALLKKCRLLISGDSGPVHIASCVGIPVIALFRNDMPEKSSRRWGPTSRVNIVIAKNNLKDITVSEVFDKAKEFLSR
ncbi:MAG: glycosyltransferase family 9 protein [Candidatus Omnitrophica bacterium]|nr:glycosyltransferase family 9 protein [Candidatus Omnitrophota bacterium]